eukprot:NODE_385_length_2130_cov_750.334455_g309_i0.p1 GENE.NODE_385_length_2130_cov_750.334455_g309_i0~~NODE_385_length_2130_cov_750.334455_g309_i0.p1  ORF type:complete len:483 (-),score=75.13 NODE_385_length_2130_cov_750.334455_g309_i0:682-2049(-)
MLGCADDSTGCAGYTSTLTTSVEAGACYTVRVGGWSAKSLGTGTLTVTCNGAGSLPPVPSPEPAPEPAPEPSPEPEVATSNNRCADAWPLQNGQTAFDTREATTDGVAHASCETSGDGGQTFNDIWFHYTATCTGTLSVSTCGSASYDTDLVVYSGCGQCAQMDMLKCQDDSNGCAGYTSTLATSVTGGSCYTVRVGGWNTGESGTGTLTVTCNANKQGVVGRHFSTVCMSRGDIQIEKSSGFSGMDRDVNGVYNFAEGGTATLRCAEGFESSCGAGEPVVCESRGNQDGIYCASARRWPASTPAMCLDASLQRDSDFAVVSTASTNDTAPSPSEEGSDAHARRDADSTDWIPIVFGVISVSLLLVLIVVLVAGFCLLFLMLRRRSAGDAKGLEDAPSVSLGNTHLVMEHIGNTSHYDASMAPPCLTPASDIEAQSPLPLCPLPAFPAVAPQHEA